MVWLSSAALSPFPAAVEDLYACLLSSPIVAVAFRRTWERDFIGLKPKGQDKCRPRVKGSAFFNWYYLRLPTSYLETAG